MTANNSGDYINSDFSLIRQIPDVLRARGFRLYLADGKRLTDLWLNGGAAVLGHTPSGLLREIKNTASRGLYAPYPHFTENRFLKALSALFPGRCFRFYAAPPEEITGFLTDGRAKLWRPFADAAPPPLFITVLPGIQTWRGGLPFGLCVIAAASEDYFIKFPRSDALPPVLSAAAVRGVYDIIAAADRGKLKLPRVFNQLRNSIWRRQGIYLTLKKEPSGDEWAALFHRFYNAGFLLPPVQSHPLILPGEISDGEEVKLAELLS